MHGKSLTQGLIGSEKARCALHPLTCRLYFGQSYQTPRDTRFVSQFCVESQTFGQSGTRLAVIVLQMRYLAQAEQRPGDALGMTNLTRKREAFQMQLPCAGEVPLNAGDNSQMTERIRDATRVFLLFSLERETLLYHRL